MILATITVFFRDMEYLWEVILMLIMYTCAIFTILKNNEQWFSWILKLNPLYCIIQNFRDAILGQQMNIHLLVYAAIVSVIDISYRKYSLFNKKQDQFILHV